ncbi:MULTISPECIES: DUF6585 family protein [Streptomyces]|uniref:Uncharacterized protein n=1 Tax=Streptomyces morookaense TaxID=1970 RepID=A0A7Y7B9Z8_STRMO|nr:MULTISPECIES: DUF6585 family protein [Streptomyces]MCC2277297.1 hypothetical protein [Streptomyces sp. ET3-23]NVK81711.1 hypothetical protein [Streptomyces morookaense]GHF43574.1 hypothetical protein GCM10010359_52790 [Streptomyces morookaense]
MADSPGEQAASGQDAYGRAIHELAGREGLGEHRAAYPSIAPAQRQHLGRVRVAAAVLAALAVLCVVTGHPALLIILGGPLVVCLIAMARYGRVSDRNEGSRLDLYERGLTIAHRGHVRAVRYTDTDVLQDITRHTYNGMTTRISYAYTVTDTTGERVILRGGFADPHEWGPAIQRAVTVARFPQALAQLAAGQRLDFGPLWMTASGIGSGGKSVPWQQVEEITVKDGYVKLRVAGRWSSLTTTSVRLIPNFFVFRALADRLRHST